METKTNASPEQGPIVYEGMSAAKANELAARLAAECVEALTPEIYRLIMDGADADRLVFLVGEPPSRRPREFPLGFQQDVKSGSDKVSIISRPEVVYAPKRLFIPGSVHEHFVVHDILVNGVPQFAKHTHSQTTSGRGHTWVRIAADTARVAEDIAIVVENKTNQDRRFRAALVGLAAR
jgi:hypothetical protein